MENKRFNVGVSDVVLVVLGVLFFLGSMFLFGACGPKEDGTWMTCHWAGNIISALAATLSVIAVVHALVRDAKVKLGLSVSVIIVSFLILLVPGKLIGLCMMDSMRCHSIMTPSSVIFSVIMIAAAAADIFVQRKR